MPSLLYGLSELSLELRHFKTIDAFYHQYLRRCMGIKASYYSRTSNRTVWQMAGKPQLPSQTLLIQQLQRLIKTLATSPQDPLHHVVFSPGYKDRVKFTKGTRRGHPQRYWLELVVAEALQVLKHYLEYNALEHRKDLLGLKQALTQYPDFSKHLETAPTRQPEIVSTVFLRVLDAHGSRKKLWWELDQHAAMCSGSASFANHGSAQKALPRDSNIPELRSFIPEILYEGSYSNLGHMMHIP